MGFDFLPLVFLLLVVLVSGLIAYLGDHIGRKLGKKRLSVFGLRPRHTAALGTALTGAVVSLLTILVLFALSSGVRTWILVGRRAIAQRNQALTELKQVQVLGNHLRAEVAGLNQTISAQRVRVRRGEDHVRSLEKSARVLTSSVKSLNGKMAVLTGRNALVSRRLAHERLQLRKNLTATEALRAKEAVTKAMVSSASKQLSSIETREEVLDEANQRLTTDIRTLNGQASMLNQQKQALILARKAAQVQLNQANAQLQIGKQEFDSLNAKLAKSRSDLAGVEAERNVEEQILQTTFESSRYRPLTFGYGEEVARIEVKPGLSPSDAEQAVQSLLHEARIDAEIRGARANGPRFPVAAIQDRIDPQTQRLEATAEAIQASVVQQLTDSKQELVVIASSSLNAFQGEPVSLDIRVLPDPVVYHSGQVVAEGIIDGGQSSSRILTSLASFVSSKVESAAKRFHMIPKNSGSDRYGSVSIGSLLDLVQQLKDLGRRVRVQAIAQADTRAADPLKLEFRIR